MAVDPRTPVVVGVGQFTERIDDPAYRGMSSVELATGRAGRAGRHRRRRARRGAGDRGVRRAAAVRDLHAVRKPPLGCSDNYLRSVAQRVGADPARAVLEPIGGNGPQKLVTEFAGGDRRRGYRGGVGPRLRAGVDARSTSSNRDDKPDFTEHVGGQLEDRGYGFEQYMSEYTAKHGLTGAPVQYGLLDNARRARLGLGVGDYRRQMAELFAPFSKVAAKNPFSSSPVERSVDEIMTVTDENRMICDPYPRLLVARDQVNQGAAALLMSVAAARRLGVPEEKWVYLRGHADQAEQDLLDRADVECQLLCETGCGRSASGGRNRHRRRGDLRSLQLLPVPGFRRCATSSGSRNRRPAWAHAHRRPAVLRRARQQLFAARRSPRRSLRCGTSQGHSAWSAPTAAS